MTDVTDVTHSMDRI